MSDNQRNTTTNETDPDTAETARGGDVETTEKDTAEAGAAVTTEVDDKAEAATGATEAGTAEETGDEDEGSADKADTGSEAAAGPAEPVAEDRAEAGGTPVSESKTSVPEGPSAVKASLSSRKAHLSVSRVEPWSVMKFSFVVSLVCFIILFVAIAVIYATLSMLGVFDELTNMLTALLEGDGTEDELGLDPASWFSPGRVLGYTGVVGALNIVLITALSTVGAMLYNLVADLVGGIDVTLSEAE
ncbi:DUF3566 domain-containing protein [Nocardiopsis dassonvillei]|jgi:hypothetical protein|uniref:DUF3566 domain-containing protein n=1 Tax=Nocardiopsis dassonvillei TaxID=2014 RepID=UPI0020A36817|nr:DUF3566 domain-containing protein [Nocardiopsis dassonvillei]MCP3015265.1 DUF3566 domain-containing protein [Nocardiopsis dassonvillei]